MDENTDCAGLLKRINDRMQKAANERCGAYGITYVQMQTLMTLRYMGGEGIPLKSLERHFGVAQSTAAGIIVRLEKKGFIESCISADDRRLKIVWLTEAGETLCASMENNFKEGNRLLLDGLDDEEKIEFFRLLEKVYRTMK